MQDSATLVGDKLRKYDWVNMGIAYAFLYVPLSDLIYDYYGKGSLPAFAVRGIFLASFICALPMIYKSLNSRSIIFLVLGFVMYVGSVILNNDTILVNQANQALLVWCIPFFLYGISVSNHENLIRCLKWVSVPILAVQLVKTVFMDRFEDIGSYDQALGYENVVPLMVYWVSFLKHKRLTDLLVPLVSFALILMSGSRGPIMCVILGLALSIVIYNGLKLSNFLYLIILFVLVLLLYSAYYIQIFSWALENFTDLSVSTRTIEQLLSNSIDDDDQRLRLLAIAKDYILEHPLYGTGLLNDRSYMYGIYRSDVTTIPFGAFCHNVFYEVMMQFGAYPGLALIILFFYYLYLRFKQSKTNDERGLYCIILSIGFFPLFVSHSYLTYPHFYILLGLLFVEYAKRESIKDINK